MAAPKVGISPEPMQSGRVVYLALSAPTAQSAAHAQLSLTVLIENKHGKPLHLNKVTLTFSDPAAPPESIAADLDIGTDASALWVHGAGDNVLLDFPAPTEITIWLKFDGFADQAKETFDLGAFVSPLPGGAYGFPASFADLERGQYWEGMSSAHGPAGGGVQLFGYDMGVVRFDESSGSWTALIPGGSWANNEDYLVWGKPIVSMADGVVQSWLDGEPTNPSPPQDLSPPGPVEGNHFYIQHGDALVLYAHLQEGTLNPDLLHAGATVTRGERLGLAGNSGNSTAPHLHIHAIRGTSPWNGPPWPIPFRWIRAINQSLFAPPYPSAQWDVVSREGLPPVRCAIGPDHTPSRQPPRRPRVPEVADPMSLVLSGYVYAKIKSPNPPPIEVVVERAARLADEAEAWRRTGLPDLPPALARKVEELAKELSAR